MMACVKEGRNRYKVSSHNSGMKCDNLITYSYIILSNHFTAYLNHPRCPAVLQLALDNVSSPTSAHS